jgi:Leucine-rich repeat (LRR) protein
MEINLTGQNLCAIPDAVYAQPVEILRLSQNRIQRIAGRRLPLVKILYLDNNQLTEIPEGVFALPALKVLIVSRNRIQVLSASIKACTTLRELWIYDNLLTDFPDELYQLKGLTGLYANSNRLTRLSPKILELENLQTLILSRNTFAEIPQHLTGLKRLEMLYLQETGLPGQTARAILDGIVRADKATRATSVDEIYPGLEECHICMTGYKQMVQLKCFASHRVCTECYPKLRKCPFCCAVFV